MRFILEDRALPFSPRERIFAALAVQYHRGPIPKNEHPLYCTLSRQDRQTVRLIAGILRIADGLDLSHTGIVRSVETCLSNDILVFLLHRFRTRFA
jgi:exopolyphosphatase/guanosine-5'-triphosphate,3'-diphosphate pyrophosphatase